MIAPGEMCESSYIRGPRKAGGACGNSAHSPRGMFMKGILVIVFYCVVMAQALFSNSDPKYQTYNNGFFANLSLSNYCGRKIYTCNAENESKTTSC